MKLSEKEKCIIPIFFEKERSRNLEHVGSSVFVEINQEKFLLTAAHVMDYLDHGSLMAPAESSFIVIGGWVTRYGSPVSRDSDKHDIAYWRLKPETAEELRFHFTAITRQDVFLSDIPNENDLYTFCGYPYRKSKIKGRQIETEHFAYTGGFCSVDCFNRMGYHPSSHILTKFRRRGAISLHTGDKNDAPLPHGISGGGVFAWTKKPDKENDDPEIALVGICHTYHEEANILAGTRIGSYIDLIANRHPDLFPELSSKLVSDEFC